MCPVTDEPPAPRPALAGIAAAATRVLQQLELSPLRAGLHVVATPIGNLADITLRALAVLARADVIYCEDTRHSLHLLKHYAIERPLSPYHEHNAEYERPRILARLARGETVALISDAGTPLISDPGFKLVQEARDGGHGVWCLPGPASPIAALSIAGLPTDRFAFEGFLPPRTVARRVRLTELRLATATLVFLEAPQRLAETLADMAAVLGERPAAVARELTKIHEAVHSGTLPALATWAAAQPVKGEMVVLVGQAAPLTADDDTICAALREALATLSVRDASKQVADTLRAPRHRVYQLALSLKPDR